MAYFGEVKNGVVVLKDGPDLEEGSIVRVELVEKPPQKPPRGSIEALLSFKPEWAGDPAEVDRMLEEIQRDRDADLTPADDTE